MQIILYGIVGGITTLINIIAYWACTRVLYIPVVASTVIAWIVALIFAYWANRKFVFHSTVNTFSGIIKEASEFVGFRIITGLLDVIIMYLFVDVFGFYDVIVKTVSNIIVIILNYIASKIIIFKGEKS